MIEKLFNRLMRVNNKRIAQAALKISKHWPDICLWTGLASGVGAVVSTAVQTTKLEPIIDEHAEQMRVIHQKAENDKEYAESAKKKADTVKVYGRTAGKIGKLYALPAGLEALSIATRVSGHSTLKSENLALAAAYTGVLEAYKKVREKKAEDDEDKPPFDEVNVELKDCTDEEKRNDIIQKEMIRSPYVRVFREGNPYWTNSLQTNLLLLRKKRAELNDRFHARGYMFLNEVLEMIGMPQCEIGQIVGWVEGSGGDDFIAFNETPIMNPHEEDGYSPSIWLDFNVDGDIQYIWDRIMGGSKESFLVDRAPKEEE